MLALAAAAVSAPAGAEPLPQFNADPAQVTVSGISSGAAMAVQAQVAYSSTFRGAAVFAGMPFYCAYGNVAIGMGTCAEAATAAQIDVPKLVALTRDWADRGWVDDPANLARAQFYLFSGKLDQTVRQGSMDAVRDYFLHFTAPGNITYRSDVLAGHGWISPLGPVLCASQQTPFINDCQLDPQQVFLSMFYGPLLPKQTGALTGTLKPVDQVEFVDGGQAATQSLDNNGWLYVPESCRRGESCRLHVAFHGCSMTYNKIGDQFIRMSGLNEWADTNRIIVLYPQALPTTQPVNGLGCWDWWGYGSPDYAKKHGPQMLMTKRMVDRITAAHAPVAAPANLQATQSGAAGMVRLNWAAPVGATGYWVYRNEVALSVEPVSGVEFTDRTVAPNRTYAYTVRAVASNGNLGPPSSPATLTTR
jgi:hypothetical protein